MDRGEDERAAILEMPCNGSIACSLRLAHRSAGLGAGDGAYGRVNERDELGNDLVPDYRHPVQMTALGWRSL